MKEQLYTIPLNDAFHTEDECPFCHIKRSLEQHSIEFVLGASQASYMEDNIRAETDRQGFCADHFHKLFVYGNRLGSALIMETHLKNLRAGLEKEISQYAPGKKASLFSRFSKNDGEEKEGNNISRWIDERESTCYICDSMKKTYDRYIDTFFEMYRKDAAFRETVKNGKGFCLKHFSDILKGAEARMNEKEKKELYDVLFPQMLNGLSRITEDVEWFQKKFDYRFKDADWKNAKDSVQRAMQKVAGGYPADPPFEAK